MNGLPDTSDAADAERFRWLISQGASIQSTVLRPPHDVEHPEKLPDIVRADIDELRGAS